MGRRIAAFLLAVLLLPCFFVLPMHTEAALKEVLGSGSAGASAYWILYEDGTLEFSGTGRTENNTEFIVKDWSVYASKIKRIIFREGITYIGTHLFNGFWERGQIESLTLPSSLEEIGAYAFTDMYDCIQTVHIPDLARWCSIRFRNGGNPLGTRAQLYVNGQQALHLKIPDSVTEICDYAFMGSTTLRVLEIPASVTHVGSYALNTCPNLQKVIFRGNAPSFGESVFTLSGSYIYYPANNSTWTADVMQSYGGNVTWIPYDPKTEDVASDSYPGYPTGGQILWTLDPASGILTLSGSGAMQDFDKNSNLPPWEPYKDQITGIVIHGGITKVGAYAFYECSNVRSLVLGEGIQQIGQRAFSSLDKLGELVLPSTLTDIGQWAFESCGAIQRLIIPASVTHIGLEAFQMCWDLEKLIFLGNAPTDSAGCLDYCDATVYYPAENPTWTEQVKSSMSFTVTWVAETHNYVPVVTAATCVDGGYTTYTCSSCEMSYTSDFVSPTGHNMKEATCTRPKTCQNAGCRATEGEPLGHSYSDGFCTVCGVEEPPFPDVIHGEFYYDAVKWALAEGITTGLTPNKFGPDESCTRGQIVTFLWRSAGCPEPESRDCPFTDVDSRGFYYTAMLWAVEQGITNGYGSESVFNPDGVCTRSQIVTFLHRAAGSPESGSAVNQFTDIRENAYYYHAVLWAVEQGITKGYGSEMTFFPDGFCTRGQCVTFLYRAAV